jgi:integrase
MAGRIPALNWTRSRGQYTVTISGKFHLLGTDKDAAEQQYRFLLNKHDLGELVSMNSGFAEVADLWLEHVQNNFSATRYRLCKARLEEFIKFVGTDMRVKELRANHVNRWIDTRNLKPGTNRLYKATILAALNWAAGKKVRLLVANPLKGMLELPEGDSRGGEVVWPKAVFDQVIRVAHPAFTNVVRMLAWTGARPSTICQVEAKHYRPHLRLWDVEELYKKRKSNRKYVRRIWLPEQAIEIVEKLNHDNPCGPIFRNSHGNPWRSETLGVYMFQLQHKFTESKKLNWPQDFAFMGYDIRSQRTLSRNILTSWNT